MRIKRVSRTFANKLWGFPRGIGRAGRAVAKLAVKVWTGSIEEWLFWKLYVRFRRRSSRDRLENMWEWLALDIKLKGRREEITRAKRRKREYQRFRSRNERGAYWSAQ